MRCRGPWAGAGEPGRPPVGQQTGYAFGGPRDFLSVTGPNVGYSASADDVLRELTLADLPMLETRRDSARASQREDHALDAEWIIRELRGEPQPYTPCDFFDSHHDQPACGADPKCPWAGAMKPWKAHKVRRKETE